jgi:Lon protease-like protein
MAPDHKELPLFPLNVVLFPRMTLPLRIFEPRYLQMVDECVRGDAMFGVVCIKEGQEVGGPAIPYGVGTTARIIDVEKKSSDLLHITAVGQQRFQVRRVVSEEPYLVGEIESFPMRKVDAPEVGALVDGEIALLSMYLDLLSRVSEVQVRMQQSPDTPEAMAYFIAMLLQVPLSVKQWLLSVADLPTLLHEEAALLRGGVKALTIVLRGQDIVDNQRSASFFSMN